LFLLLVAGCAAVAAVPPGTTAFALFGDTPYSENEAERLERLIDDLNANELAFVVHIGDITSGQGPCTDEWFEARKRQFARIKHAFVLLPGDNDWTDCHRSGFDPLERLRHWRELFCFQEKLALERQRGEYCEHVRWQAGDVLFVALNVQGSNNNLGRTAAMDREYAARMRAVFAWIDDCEKLFREKNLARLVLLMQADPFLIPGGGRPNGFATMLERLRALGERYPGKVVLVNGDTHRYRDDEPLPGVRRIEPWGSPIVSWLRGAIRSGEISVEVASTY
jgi:hypothetical protein